MSEHDIAMPAKRGSHQTSSKGSRKSEQGSKSNIAAERSNASIAVGSGRRPEERDLLSWRHPRLDDFYAALDAGNIPHQGGGGAVEASTRTIDQQRHDRDMSRWLEARQGDIAKAKAMYTAHLKFREMYSLDNGFRETYKPPEVLGRYYPGGIYGRDREGYIVKYEMPGKADLKGMSMSVTDDQFTHHAIYLAELMLHHARQPNPAKPDDSDPLDDKWVVVVDCDSFGVKHLTTSIMHKQRLITRVFEDNYPDRLHRSFFINCSKLFKILLSMMKQNMDPKTFEKITILESEQDLLKYIDPSQVPDMYGGEARDYSLNTGGVIPKSYHANEMLLETSKDWPKIEVKAGSEMSIPLEKVNEGGNKFKLNLDFFTLKNRITVSVLRAENTTSTAEPVRLYPKDAAGEKAECEMCITSVSIDCDQPGVYIARFSNIHSRFKPKTVVYNHWLFHNPGSSDSSMSGP